MRALFLVSDTGWSARARAFVLAARGLAARGHDVQIGCAADCPVQVRVAQSQLPVVAMDPSASTAGTAWHLRKTLLDKDVDVVFVHSDAEHLTASSALRLGRGGGVVVKRVPPMEIARRGRGTRIASRIAPTGLLFSTEADREAADLKHYRVPAVVAPLAVDPAEHDATREIARASLGVPANAQLVVCVHDGSDKRPVLAALRTVALLSPRRPDLHLLLVGSSRQDELRMHGAALGVNTMVSFLGARDDELSILKVADIGWVAAEGDAAAFAALDFMALRIPLIAERTALTEHYVADGIAGMLLQPADPTHTAGSVAAFLARSPQRAAMGNAGRARLQREFPFETMIQGYEQVAAGALERGAQPVG